MVRQRLRRGLILDALFFALLAHLALTHQLVPEPLRDLLRGEPREVAVIEEIIDETLFDQDILEPAQPSEDGSQVDVASGSLA